MTDDLDPDFPILRDIEEAQALRNHLVDEMQMIQAQLSDKNVQRGGQRIGSISYHEWRQKKVLELTRLNRHIRYVKGWIRTHSARPAPVSETKPASRERALETLYRRFKAYVEYQRSGSIDPGELDSRWDHLIGAMEDIEKTEKAEKTENEESRGNEPCPSTQKT